MRFTGSGAALRVHSDIVAAERVGTQATIVTARFRLRHTHNHHPLLRRLDVLVRPVRVYKITFIAFAQLTCKK